MTSDDQTPNKPNNHKISSNENNTVKTKSKSEIAHEREPDREKPYDHTKPIVNNDNVVTNNTNLILQTYY